MDLGFLDKDHLFSGSDDDSSDNEILDELEEYMMRIILQASSAYISYMESFHPSEPAREDQISVNPHIGVHDVLASMLATPPNFRWLTNFIVEEFQELCALVCPTIVTNARSTRTERGLGGRKLKLTPERLLSFILYLKHDNTIYLDSRVWNWSRSALCDDAIFVSSCINHAIENEIKWPDAEERKELGTTIPQILVQLDSLMELCARFGHRGEIMSIRASGTKAGKKCTVLIVQFL